MLPGPIELLSHVTCYHSITRSLAADVVLDLASPICILEEVIAGFKVCRHESTRYHSARSRVTNRTIPRSRGLGR